MRVDASVVIFLSIFLPTLTRTGSLTTSLRKAAPMLFAAFCTWIANDLNDRDRDRINHPERPLPSGRITPRVAATLFFVSLGAALTTTYRFIEAQVAFWYYLVIILALSYGYVVDWIPALKAAYVAAAMTIPIVVTVISYPYNERFARVAAAVFCFALGKEICMDLLDRPGDTPSALHRLSFKTVARAAFIFLLIGLLLLSSNVSTALDGLYLFAMVSLWLVAGWRWFRQACYRSAIRLLRLELFAGLYFLL